MVKIRNGLIVEDEEESLENDRLISQGVGNSDSTSHVVDNSDRRFTGSGRALGNSNTETSRDQPTLLPLENSMPTQTNMNSSQHTGTSWTQNLQQSFQSFVNNVQSNTILRNIQQFLFMDISFFGLFNFKVIYFVVFSLLIGFIFGWQSVLISVICIVILYFCAASRNFNMSQEQQVPSQEQQQQQEQVNHNSGRTLGRNGNIHTLN